MARPFRPPDKDLKGRLEVQDLPNSDCVAVFYTPSPEELKGTRIGAKRTALPRVKLLELCQESGRLTIFPINTFGKRPDFLEPKYGRITRITLADATPVVSESSGADAPAPFTRSITFGDTQPLDHTIDDADISDQNVTEDTVLEILEELPPVFTKDYDYGLGFAHKYRFIIEAIENLCDCTEIVVTDDSTTIDPAGDRFYLSWSDLDAVRKSLNRVTSVGRTAAASVKSSAAYNFLAQRLGRPSIPTRVSKHALRKLFTATLESGGEALSDDEQEEVLTAVANNVTRISATRPAKLTQLQKEIELVNLRTLIDRFDEMMAQGLSEPKWQSFFDDNPFVLSLAFGYPVVVVQGQASVGGRTLSRKGNRITDFLVKNSMTNNTAIIEIKTPQTKLLNESSYRDGVFTPSSAVSGAVNQALEQKNRFEREIATIKDNTRKYDLESYSVHCCLIVGTIPVDEERRKSFEMYRGNSKAVELVTFDELLLKLRNLHDFLTTPETEAASGEASDRGKSEDVPF